MGTPRELYFFREEFQLIKAERIIKLENHYFSKEIMNVGNDDQGMLKLFVARLLGNLARLTICEPTGWC